MCDLTKDKIKERALTLFVEKGYAGTTLADIGTAVGIKNNPFIHILKIKITYFTSDESSDRRRKTILEHLFH